MSQEGAMTAEATELNRRSLLQMAGAAGASLAAVSALTASPAAAQVTYPVGNWVMLPAPWRIDAPPRSASEQKWVMILSGVAGVDFHSRRTSDWHRDSFHLSPDTKPAIEWTGVRAQPGRKLAFQVEQWAPYATLNAIVDKGSAVNLGFAVDSYKLIFGTVGVERIPKIFGGLEVQAAVRDDSAILHRIGYQITLVGSLVQYTPELID